MTGHRKKLVAVPATKIVIDRIDQGGYQRPCTQDRVINMALDWDEDAFQPLVVNRRLSSGPNIWYLVDGQHRFEALGLRNQYAPNIEVPCIEYVGLTRAEEAKLYRQLNTERKNTIPLYAWKARLSEKDPLVVDVERIVASYGFCVAAGSSPTYLPAVGSLEKIYSEYGGGVLNNVLRVVVNAWCMKKQAPAVVLRAVGQFIGMYPEADKARIAMILEYNSPQGWIVAAKRATDIDTGANLTHILTTLLVLRYNRRLNQVRQLDSFENRRTQIMSAKRSEGTIDSWVTRRDKDRTELKSRPKPGDWLRAAPVRGRKEQREGG